VKSLCSVKHHANRHTAQCILNLGTIGRWVVSFTIRQLYSGKRDLGIN